MSDAHRIGAGSVLSMLLIVSAVACDGSVSRSLSQAGAPRDAEADVARRIEGDATRRSELDATRPRGAWTTPCGHYFVAQYERCGGPVLPAREATRIRARFEAMCQNEIALPGSGMTAATVEACASALDAASCQLPAGPPEACNFHGSLAEGAPCNDGLQCESGQCQGTGNYSPGGQIGPFTCGTCVKAVAVGQVCAHGDLNAGCGSDAICLLTSPQTSPDPTYTCAALVEGDVGASCDDLSLVCKPGLYCSAQTKRCAKLGGAGASCGEGNDWAGGCAAPLSCAGIMGAWTCGIGSSGATCLTDGDCAPGLGCVPGSCSSTIARIGCSASGTCEAVTWAAPGQPCDDYRTRCLAGSCNVDRYVGDGGVVEGTCPEVVPDGQPCTVQGVGPLGGNGPTCDTFAECFSPVAPAGTKGPDGTCTLLHGTVCR